MRNRFIYISPNGQIEFDSDFPSEDILLDCCLGFFRIIDVELEMEYKEKVNGNLGEWVPL